METCSEVANCHVFTAGEMTSLTVIVIIICLLVTITSGQSGSGGDIIIIV